MKKIKFIWTIPENHHIENSEEKFVTENGFQTAEESHLLTSKETLINLDYVNIMHTKCT